MLTDAGARRHAANRVAIASSIMDIARLIQNCHAVRAGREHGPAEWCSSAQSDGGQQNRGAGTLCHGEVQGDSAKCGAAQSGTRLLRKNCTKGVLSSALQSSVLQGDSYR